MKDGRIIHQSTDGLWRVMEYIDTDADFENLCGDTFNPKVNSDIDPSLLKQQLEDFTDLVNREGVYGYVLEKWNPEIGVGWEHMDSCWGFVGSYSDSDLTFKHYIVDELKEQIK